MSTGVCQQVFGAWEEQRAHRWQQGECAKTVTTPAVSHTHTHTHPAPCHLRLPGLLHTHTHIHTKHVYLTAARLCHRIQTYLTSTRPVIDQYLLQGKVRTVDASRSVEEASADVPLWTRDSPNPVDPKTLLLCSLRCLQTWRGSSKRRGRCSHHPIAPHARRLASVCGMSRARGVVMRVYECVCPRACGVHIHYALPLLWEQHCPAWGPISKKQIPFRV